MSKYYRWLGHADEIFSSYWTTKRLLKRFEADAIYQGRSLDGMPHGSGISDPTGKAGLALSSQRIMTMEREVRAVEMALEQLELRRKGQAKARLMRLAYVERRSSLVGAAAYLGISYSTAKRWKQEACLLLAWQLGWL